MTAERAICNVAAGPRCPARISVQRLELGPAASLRTGALAEHVAGVDPAEHRLGARRFVAGFWAEVPPCGPPAGSRMPRGSSRPGQGSRGRSILQASEAGLPSAISVLNVPSSARTLPSVRRDRCSLQDGPSSKAARGQFAFCQPRFRRHSPHRLAQPRERHAAPASDRPCDRSNSSRCRACGLSAAAGR